MRRAEYLLERAEILFSSSVFYAASKLRTSVNFGLGVYYGCVWLHIRARPD